MKNINDVVKGGLCIGCGMCTYSENVDKTVFSKKYDQFIPVLSEASKRDQIAFHICPGKGYDIIKDAEERFNEGSYDLELGRVYKKFAAYSNDTEVLKHASSGGIMSQIAIYLLERKIVDRVLTTAYTYDGSVRSVSYLAKNKAEILHSQGSKYCPVDLSESIKEIKNNELKVAIIGTPCQIAAIRNIQKTDSSFNRKVILTIANFCGGVKGYKNIDILAKRNMIDPSNITFFRFRGNGQPGSMRMQDRWGNEAEIPYPKYVGLNGISKHLRCHLCVDATGELSDISCGDAWLERFLKDKNPWSIILTRNIFSNEIIENMISDGVITVDDILFEEIKKSQRQNLFSKKYRQKSRFKLYRMIGYQLPKFDGGFLPGKIKLGMELRIFCKHKVKYLLERLRLYNIIYKKIKK